jgi:hypothetical protein
MKKVLTFLFLILFAVTLSLTSCGARTETVSNNDSTVVDSTLVNDTTFLNIDSIPTIKLKK